MVGVCPNEGVSALSLCVSVPGVSGKIAINYHHP